MSRPRTKTFLISFLLAAVAVCLSVALVACKGGDKNTDSGKYGVGEEGVYYYDKDASTEYLMTLQSGTYMISADGTKGYSGTYSYDDGTAITFKSSDGETFEAAFSDDAMQLEITGTPYTFLKKVDYTVKFMDGSSSVATQSVTYGKSASKIDAEKDGYIFIGWYEDAAFTTQYRFNTAITGDMTLYAYYIALDTSIPNYEVQFISGGDVIYTTTTQNGVVYDFPEDETGDWWVSATNSADELTYKYDGETLTEATKLFADTGARLGLSVYGDGLKWETSVSSATIEVDGEVKAQGVTGTSYSYDFDSLSTGRHEITVTGSGVSETRVYVTNGLSRVSNFSVYGTTLVYNAVEGAQYYYISVTCANTSHDHTMVYNGNTLTYDFSNCEMGPDGITFTVYAYATGYETSVSETYVYALILDGTTVKIDSATDTASWTAVSGATGYEVYVNDEYVATTTNTEYSLKYYNINDKIAVSVKPVAPGYYSEESAAAEYTKATLRAPEITGINEYTVSWTEIPGATNYIIYVNGKQIETVSDDITEYAYALDKDNDFVKADSYVITIKATNSSDTNQNSQESDPVYATDDTMSPLLVYEDGVVYWQYAMAAGTYRVSINDGDETEVVGKNSFDVTFTQSGENVIKVYFKTDAGDSAVASLSVTTYAVIFNSEGGTIIDTIYVAKGDTLSLDTPTYSYGTGENTFLGWYTLPNPEGVTAKNYLGDGVKVESGSVFSGSGTLILYACWEILKSNTRLVVGNYGNVDGEDELYYEIPVNTDSYDLPVPIATDAAYIFYGWYSEPNGRGTQYTYYDGTARNSFSNTNVTTVYAYWIQILGFEPTTYMGESYAEVSQGPSISLVPGGTVTVPSTYTIDGTEYLVGVVGSAAFSSCSNLVTLNLPDTVVYISTVNNGVDSGSGAFAGDYALSAVNIYSEGTDRNTTREIFYYSEDGVLYRKIATDSTGGVELIYYPDGKTNTSFVIPEYVSNENEYELQGSDEVKVYRPVTQIAQKVLNLNSYITDLTVSATVSVVDIQAFMQMTRIVNVTFADAVENTAIVSAASTLSLGSKAFQKCTTLEKVVLPSRLGTFVTDAFDGCTNFKDISIADGGTYTSYEGILYSGNNTVYYCPRGRADDIVWSGAATIVGESAFEGCTKLTSINIPTTITTIGVSAFEGCTAVTELTFADRTEANPLAIYSRAFYGCTRLTSVELPLGLETIGAEAFAGCTRLTYVYYDCAEGATAEYLDFAAGAFGTSVTTLEFGEFVPLIEDFVIIFGSTNLSSVIIDEANPNYTEDDSGVIYGLYSETSTILMWTPPLRGAYTVMDGCTAIGPEAFKDRTTVSSVAIPATVVEIGVSAFEGCTALTIVTFASGSALTTIGDYAFANSGLTFITIPASVKYIGEYDGDELVAVNVFEGCTNLTGIEVETGSEYFASEDGILYTTENGAATQLVVCPAKNTVTEIVIPSTIKKIWDNAFYGTTIKKVSFASGAVDEDFEFGDSVFYGSSLEEIDLPVGLTAIPAMLFERCSSLKTVVIPYTVTSIGGNAFYYCTSLESVVFEDIPSGATLSDYPLTFEDSSSLGVTYGTFYQCNSLKEIAIPDRTVSLSAQVLGYCGSLETVVIGSEVEELPEKTFRSDYELTSVTFGNDPQNEVKLTKIDAYAFTYCGKSSSPLEITVPATVTSIGDAAFHYCYISSLTLQEGLETMGTYLFSEQGETTNMSTLTELYIPSTVTEIGTFAFVYCKSLETVTFGDGSGLTRIEDATFRFCSSLKSINIPAAVESIGSYAFDGCTALSSVTFLTETGEDRDTYGYSSTTTISSWAFQNCTSLTEFAFPETSEDITLGSAIFKGCKNLTKLVLSAEMTSLGSSLSGCYSITEIDTSNSKYFDADENAPVLYSKSEDTETATKTLIYVFGDVTGEFVVPEDVTAIADAAFATQITLTKVSLPVTITDIGKYAFDGCLNLAEIEFYEVQGAVQGGLTIADIAFRQTALKEVDFGALDTVTVGRAAFAYCEDLETVILSENVTLAAGTGTGIATIGTFGYCTGLETVVLGGLDAIPGYTFYNCTNLKTIAQSVGDIEDGTFDLEGIDVGTAALYATAVEKIVMNSSTTLPTSNTSGTNAVFYNCTSLTTIILGGFTVPKYQFYNCSALKCIGETEADLYVDGMPVANLADADLTGTYLFYGASSIEMLVLSTNQEVSTYAFYGCTALRTVGIIKDGVVDYELGVANFDSIHLDMGAFCNSGLEYVKLSTTTTLDKGEGTGAKLGAFGSCASLTTIDLAGISSTLDYMFYGCTSLTTLINYENITEIGAYAFYNCTSLTTLPMTDITSVGADAFYGCTALASVPSKGITSLGNYAFYKCSSLTTIGQTGGVIDLAGLLTLGTYAFQECVEIETVILPEGMGIATYDFYGCTALKTIGETEGLVDLSTIPSLGDRAFTNCESIEKVILPTGITIGQYGFDGCSSLIALATSEDGLYVDGNPVVDLTGISLGTGSSSTYYKFRNCTSMETLILDTNTTIGSCEFYGCSALKTISQYNTNVEFGKADLSFVTNTYKASFYGCGMEYLILSSTVTLTAGSGTTTSSGSFAECDELHTIILGGLDNVLLGTFYGCDSLKTIANTEAEIETGVAHLEGVTMGYAALAYTGLEKIVMDSASSISSNLSGQNASASAAKDGSISHNDYLTEIIGVTTIPAYGLYGCTALTTLASSEANRMEGVINLAGVDASKEYIFYGCTSIREVRLGDNASLGQAAFTGCTNLLTVGDEYGVADVSGISLGKGAMTQTSIETVKMSATTQMTDGDDKVAYRTGAFGLNDSLRTVDLGGAATIANRAFYGSENLTAVTGAENLSSIGSYAFYGCTALTTVGTEDGVADLYNTKTIGGSAFYGCVSVEAFAATGSQYYEAVDGILYSGNEIALVPGSISGVVSIADGTTSIGDSAFEGNTNITEVIIPASVKSIGDSAFCDCTNLVKVTILGEGVFVDDSAFESCESLEYVVAEAGLGSLGEWAFEYCYKLKEINIGPEAEYIDQYAFAYCYDLEELILPEGLTTVSNAMCLNCTSLASVTIPYTVTTIGSRAFSGCTALSNLVFEDVPEESMIGDYPLTFTYYSSDTGVFGGCTSLTTLELPSRLYNLGFNSTTSTYGNTFRNCTGLETVTIRGTNMEGIGAYVFSGCTSLKTVYIESGVTEIGQYMFSDCESLENVYIADTVTTIYRGAFNGCVSLKNIVIPESVSEMGIYYSSTSSASYDAVFSGVGSDATIYIAGSYKFSTLSWIAYSQSAAIGTKAVKENWKNDTEASIVYYMEIPDDASTLVDMGLAYWYYDATGNIVEWTVAGLAV